MRKMTRWVCALVCCCVPFILEAGERLSFKNGKFKIAQITDVHWDQGSPNCERTIASLRAVFEAERPDMAMLTGDIVTAKPGVEGWQSIIRFLEEERMPFAVMMGNHDAEVVPKSEIYALLERSPYFVGAKGPDEIQGAGNCVVPVYGATGEKPAALLYCLDSNDYPEVAKDYGTYDWIHFDQIEWYRTQSARYTRENGGKPLPALAFFHIPVPEYKEITEADIVLGRKEEGIASPDINTGFFASTLEMGDVMGTFVGHDHANDYIALLFGRALAFGRVSGWDAYGDFERGARVIELYEGKFQFDSWIRTPSGKEDTFYYPSGLSSKDENSMSYLPARKVEPTKKGVAYTYYEGKFKHTDQIATGKKVKEGVMPAISIEEAPAEDHFAYEFRTLIRIPERGVYRFYTFSDDGSQLLIDGQTVVDNNGSHSAAPAKGKVALEAGFHELRVLYFEDYMGQSLEIGVASRTIPESPLSVDWFYLPE